MILLTSEVSYAATSVIQDYEEARKIQLAVGACAAVYNDRVGELTNRYLEENGWKIDHYVQNQGHDGLRFLVAKKDFSAEERVYCLAFVGTETHGDIKFDLKVDKVYFAGNSIEELAINATKKGLPDTVPKVHRGFHEFVQSGLAAKTIGANGTPLLLSDILLTNKNCKIYLVGHSLGGAAATLAGAGLLNLGIRPEQIEVITFGAPAVGNQAFANQYSPNLRLTRIVISGDPVTGILQSLVGGYKQFGKEICWTISENRDQTHKITEYVDLSLKNYYEKRQQVVQTGIQLPKPDTSNESGKQVYIIPLKNSIPSSLSKEFWYMRESLLDEYQKKLPGCNIGRESEGDDWRQNAASLGCRWAILPEVSVTRLKQERNTYYITVSQTVYEVASGDILDSGSCSTATYNLTPLEAFIHDVTGINHNKDAWQLKK